MDSVESYLSLPFVPSDGTFINWDREVTFQMWNADLSGSCHIPIVSDVGQLEPFRSRFGEGYVTLLKFNSSTGRFSISGSFKVCDTCDVGAPIFSPEKKKIYVPVLKVLRTSTNHLYLQTYQLYQFTYSADMKAIERVKRRLVRRK